MKASKKVLGLLLAGFMTVAAITGCTNSGEKTAASTESSSAGSTVAVESTAASSKPNGNETSELTVYGVIDPQISAQQIIADKKGYFAEEGLKVTNKLIQSGGDISPLISGKTAKVSFESTYTDIALAANNVGVKVVATVADIGNTQCVVARKGVEIKSAKDLEGKKIGIAAGAGVLIAIRNMCKELGVDVNKINFVILSPSDQIAAFDKGDIDIMACWEPWVSNAVKLGGTLLFSGLKSYLPEKTGDVNWLSFYTTMQVTDDFLKANPNTVASLVKAIKKATDFIAENPDEAAEIIAAELQLEKSQVKEIMDKNKYTMEYNQAFVDASVSMAEFMKEMGNIPEAPSIDKYADPTILKSVFPELVTVK